jgi:hypothetical protein
MRVVERQFSDLLRHPKDVARDVDSSDVLLRRRDEPDLRLSLAEREEDRSEAFGALARTFRNLASNNQRELTEALGDAFGWVEFLPARDRARFVDEFSRVVTAAAEIDNYEPLSQLIREWRATAEIFAVPALARRLRSPIDADGGSVPAPV